MDRFSQLQHAPAIFSHSPWTLSARPGLILLAATPVKFTFQTTHVVTPKRILAFLKAGEKVVAGSVDCHAAVIGGHLNLYRQFRHCLGALSVFMIHARAAQHPGHLGILS